MFNFVNGLRKIGVKVGQGEQIVGGGVEAVGRIIKNHGLYVEMENRAELLVDGNRHTTESLQALYSSGRQAAVTVLRDQLIRYKQEGTKVALLDEKENFNMRQAFAAAMDPVA